MNIIHVYKTYFPQTVGGTEQVIRTLTEQTAAQGCQNTLLTTTPQSETVVETSSLKAYHYPETFSASSCPISLALWKDYKKKIQNADIIHYHFPWPFADFCHLTHGIKKPYLITYHSDIIKQRFIKPLYSPLMHWFLKGANRIVTTSPNYLESSSTLQPYKTQCTSIPLGISTQPEHRPVANAIQAWKEKVGENFFLFVGVLRYYKGLNYLIEAAQLTPELRIVIAGAGPLEKELKKQALDLKCNNVIFTGFISELDKLALLELSLGFVLPSHVRTEAFGIVLLEAMRAKKALITTEMGTGTSFINQDQTTGLIVPSQNSQALANAMRTFSNSPQKTKEMGNVAFERFQTVFTDERMGRSYLEIYRSILQNRRV